ncbi:head-closure protein [Vibrio phage 1.144.O._10N.286.45.B3]|nr:head-closure protein [Vibrio phage 1.144.O._10N.286.45.B3]
MTISMTVKAQVVAMAAKDWIDFADGLVTDFGVEFGEGSNNPQGYHVKKTTTGGTSPIDPGVVTTVDIPINMVFTTISKSLIDGALIMQGDAGLTVTNYPTEILQNEDIKRGSETYYVVAKDPANPYGTSIVQKLIVRLR